MHCLLCRNPDPVRVELPSKPPAFLWRCEQCDLLFKDSSLWLDEKDERARYELHQNGDEGHQRFLAPVVDAVRCHFPQGGRGIDWGSGPVPVLSVLLEAAGFSVDHYDPFFFPRKPKPGELYDFVTLTEVIEHVFDPTSLLGEMKACLRPGGKMVVMTEPPPKDDQLLNWGYRRDPTHVCFFGKKTFLRFEELFGLKLIEDSERLFVLERVKE
ncbi:MAG: class I SAM-dependent methyltransferase [Bdellovibrionaceae bacterium]|nr:class I SAM-dependent methyltransferase [Pseudobdellovibrionaceae bacterium]